MGPTWNVATLLSIMVDELSEDLFAEEVSVLMGQVSAVFKRLTRVICCSFPIRKLH